MSSRSTLTLLLCYSQLRGQKPPCVDCVRTVHLQREFVAWSQRTGATARIGRALLAVEKQLFGSWYRVRDGPLTWAAFHVAVLPLRARVSTLRQEGGAGADVKAQGTCRTLLKREAALWTFGWEPGVEPTNNCAERPLRRAVLWRRRSFGTQSAAGSQFVERILTAVTTLRLYRATVAMRQQFVDREHGGIPAGQWRRKGKRPSNTVAL